ARAGSCRHRRDSRTHQSAVCLELPAVRYRGRLFRIGARAAALRDRLCLAVTGAGPQAVCGARPCRGLQGHVHGGAAGRGRCGPDVIIAQGTEGGGHVGWQTTMTLVPMVVDAVAPIPVLAAGGIADGRGLAAAIMLGADGVLLGTRFLASRESSLHPN